MTFVQRLAAAAERPGQRPQALINENAPQRHAPRVRHVGDCLCGESASAPVSSLRVQRFLAWQHARRRRSETRSAMGRKALTPSQASASRAHRRCRCARSPWVAAILEAVVETDAHGMEIGLAA
jgi:hypothetical protein